MNRRVRISINKIIEEINIIAELIAEYDYLLFLNDEKTKRAVSMTLINIGELVKNLPEDFKNNNELPWNKIMGLRNVAAHGYQSLRMETIWETITIDVLVFKNQLQDIFAKESK